jgi:hypothetical protein
VGEGSTRFKRSPKIIIKERSRILHVKNKGEVQLGRNSLGRRVDMEI